MDLFRYCKVGVLDIERIDRYSFMLNFAFPYPKDNILYINDYIKSKLVTYNSRNAIIKVMTLYNPEKGNPSQRPNFNILFSLEYDDGSYLPSPFPQIGVSLFDNATMLHNLHKSVVQLPSDVYTDPKGSNRPQLDLQLGTNAYHRILYVLREAELAQKSHMYPILDVVYGAMCVATGYFSSRHYSESIKQAQAQIMESRKPLGFRVRPSDDRASVFNRYIFR